MALKKKSWLTTLTCPHFAGAVPSCKNWVKIPRAVAHILLASSSVRGRAVLVFHEREICRLSCDVVDNDKCILIPGVFIVLPSPEIDVCVVGLSIRKTLWKSRSATGNLVVSLSRCRPVLNQ